MKQSNVLVLVLASLLGLALLSVAHLFVLAVTVALIGLILIVRIIKHKIKYAM